MHSRFARAVACVAGARSRVLTVAGAIAVSLTTFPSMAEGAAPPQGCQQIEATVLRRYVAYARHDAKNYMALYTPDYVEILQTGKLLTYDSLRKGILASFSKPGAVAYRTFWCRYEIRRCNRSGNSATVDALITVGNPVYRSNAGRVDHYFYGDGHVVDQWRRTGSGWAISHRKEVYFRTQMLKHKRPRL